MNGGGGSGGGWRERQRAKGSGGGAARPQGRFRFKRGGERGGGASTVAKGPPTTPSRQRRGSGARTPQRGGSAPNAKPRSEREAWNESLAIVRRQCDVARRARTADAAPMKEALQAALGAVSGLGYPCASIKAVDCSTMIGAMCDPILVSVMAEPALRAKLCKFIAVLCARQHAVFGAASLAAALDALLQLGSSEEPEDALRGLSAVLQSHAPRCTQHYEACVNLLLRLSPPASGKDRTRQLAVSCIAVLCDKARHRLKPFHARLFPHLLAVVTTQVARTSGARGAGSAEAAEAAVAAVVAEAEKAAAATAATAATAESAPPVPLLDVASRGGGGGRSLLSRCSTSARTRRGTGYSLRRPSRSSA